jgi:ferritin-like metal-binding protein YciE
MRAARKDLPGRRVPASDDAEHKGCAGTEISRYGTLKTWAQELGLDDAVRLLEQTLDEEKKTDAALTKIAEDAVNQHAEAA